MSFEDPHPFLSVIIATKDRAEALRTTSLPSLARQDSSDFEVIVWDASEDAASAQVVAIFSSERPDIHLRYFKAPRPGLPAQRNDSMKQARGEFVFFIDDDSEVSPDGIRRLSEMFSGDDSLVAGCLPLDYAPPILQAGLSTGTGSFAGWARAMHAHIFDWSYTFTGSKPVTVTMAGPINGLVGCDMAIRTSVLHQYSLNERLQRFGGYGLYEDTYLGRQLHNAGLPMRIAEAGWVRHLAAPGNRSDNARRQGLIEAYNASVLWYETMPNISFLSTLAFVWARLGFFLVVFLPCLRWPWQSSRWKRLLGYLYGLWAFLSEELRPTRRHSTHQASETCTPD